MIFWDTSALIKAYLEPEPGHARARNLLLSGEAQAASTLLFPEAAGAVARRTGHRPHLRDAILDLLERHREGMNLVPFLEEHVESALRLARRYALRGADAVHLATALQVFRECGRRNFRFVTADAEQLAAARAEGLRVLGLP